MPELPEVETSRREVEQAALGRTIKHVHAVNDPIVFEGVPAVTFEQVLQGRKITGSGRWGKHFWLELDQRPWPVFHFGMTGWVHVYRGEENRPKFLKIELVLDDDTRLAYRDPRRLGRIRLRHDPRHEKPISDLGFDPVHHLPSLNFFISELGRRKSPIKAVLLDQSFSAGVGNWIADEVLYQSRIDPRRHACSLSRAEVQRLRLKLKTIIAGRSRLAPTISNFHAPGCFIIDGGKQKARWMVTGIQFDLKR
jgi:formamidopyrimidine-DNA glycosylase